MAGLFAAIAFFTGASARAQEDIPLELGSAGDAQRLFIYVGIDGGPAEKYLFDTGSPGFNAAFYDSAIDGPYTGSDPNPAVWSNSGTLSANAIDSFGGDDSGFSYQLNEVYVSDIEIYAPTNLTTPQLTLTATASNPGSPGFQMGQVVERLTSSGSTDPTFTAALAAGTAPDEGGVYGTFGASLFTGANTTGSGTFVNSSILGQSTTTGWVVSANGTSASAILGLNDSIRSQFTSTMAWTGSAGPNYPNSGANAATEYGGGDMTFVLSGSGHSPVTFTNGTLLDAGTQNNNLNATGVSGTALAPYETDGPPLVDNGYMIDASGTAPISGTYSFITSNTSAFVTDSANIISGTKDHSTVGIGFFLADSVAFDLQNQQTLYTSSVVTIPEPSSAALEVLGLLAFCFVRRWQRWAWQGTSRG